MATALNMQLARLGTGEFLKIRDGEGRRLQVIDGMVWITQDGDPRDAFVAKGESFVFDRGGLAIVEALVDSRMAVLASEPAETPARDVAFA
jgi:hypothetical protein